LKGAIAGIVEQSLGNINDGIVKRTATESLARVALQTPQHSSGSTPVYDTGGYREAYSTAEANTDPALTSQSSSYTPISGGATHPYNIGTSISVPHQTSNAFDHQQTYGADDPGMTTTHVAALAAASSSTSQPNNSYAYANTHSQSAISSQAPYSANSFAPQDWRQWTRTYMQPPSLGQPGEYLNTATTLMSLGGRDGGSQDPGNNGQGPLDTSGVPGHVHWPDLAYPNTNGHGHISQ
jgi:hypothetical protein